MIQHVFERARESGAGQTVIATDDERIAEAGRLFDAEKHVRYKDELGQIIFNDVYFKIRVFMFFNILPIYFPDFFKYIYISERNIF